MWMVFIVAALSLIPLVVEAGDPLVFHVTGRLQIPADDGQQVSQPMANLSTFRTRSHYSNTTSMASWSGGA